MLSEEEFTKFFAASSSAEVLLRVRGRYHQSAYHNRNY